MNNSSPFSETESWYKNKFQIYLVLKHIEHSDGTHSNQFLTLIVSHFIDCVVFVCEVAVKEPIFPSFYIHSLQVTNVLFLRKQ